MTHRQHVHRLDHDLTLHNSDHQKKIFGDTKCRYQHERIGKELCLNQLEFIPSDNIETFVTNPGPSLSITIFFQADGYGVLPNGKGIDFRSNESYLCYASQPVMGVNYFPKGCPIQLLQLGFAPSSIQDWVNLEMFQHEEDGGSLITIRDHHVWIRHMTTVAPIAQAARHIFHCTMQGAPRTLYLQSKAGEILSLMIDQWDRLHTPQRCDIGLSLRDQRKLIDARELLRNNLEKTWTIFEVSQTVQLNQKKLKYGFKKLFGYSVYAYFQNARMETARTLLASDQHSITDISLMVGYSNPSRFAKVFRQYYGCSPREFVRHHPEILS